MVRVQPERCGGARGKLSGDPAVTTAAVALLLGYSDPLGFLALERGDMGLAVAIVEKADELRAEQAKQLADYTANRTAFFLAPMLRQTIVQIARAMRG